ncbi:MAG: hypothetical protein M1298_03895, partial [Chloroflexi bacterium]|nr:hypothetical protein [Chloroflexota bacterium]
TLGTATSTGISGILHYFMAHRQNPSLSHDLAAIRERYHDHSAPVLAVIEAFYRECFGAW